jgi:hypothetical protein
MEATGGFHDQIVETSPKVTENIGNNVKHLDIRKDVLNANTRFRKAGVTRFLRRGEFTAFRLFGGLVDLGVDGLVALKAGVLVQATALGKT